jgi:hypothetical protein
MLTGITDNEIKFFLDQKMIPPEVESALRNIVKQKNAISVLDGFIANHRAQTPASPTINSASAKT